MYPCYVHVRDACSYQDSTCTQDLVQLTSDNRYDGSREPQGFGPMAAQMTDQTCQANRCCTFQDLSSAASHHTKNITIACQITEGTSVSPYRPRTKSYSQTLHHLAAMTDQRQTPQLFTQSNCMDV